MLLVLLAACSPKIDCPEPSDVGVDPTITPSKGVDGAFPDFALGVGSTSAEHAQVFGELGVSWARVNPEALSWSVLQPEEGDELDFTCADAEILAWQQAGVSFLQGVFEPTSPWAEASDAAWSEVASALVERYDGDGIDDAEGLVAPVKYWMLGPVWGEWPDAPEAYEAWAEATSNAARRAYGEVRLGTASYVLTDVFEGDPTELQVSQRLPDPDAQEWRGDLTAMGAFLSRTELYDFIAIHSEGDVSAMEVEFEWWRAQMDARSTAKPVWIDQAAPMSLLSQEGLPSWYPVSDETRETWDEVLLAVAEDPAGPEATWLEAEAARGLVQKVVTAYGLGYVGLNIGLAQDRTVPGDSRSDRKQRAEDAAAYGAAIHFGLVDAEGSPRAAYWALALSSEALGSDEWPIREAYADRGMVGWHFVQSDPSQELWVVWVDDGVLQGPGEAQEALTVNLYVGEATARWATTPTTGTSATWVDDTTAEGELRLTVDQTPVFVLVTR